MEEKTTAPGRKQRASCPSPYTLTEQEDWGGEGEGGWRRKEGRDGKGERRSRRTGVEGRYGGGQIEAQLRSLNIGKTKKKREETQAMI